MSDRPLRQAEPLPPGDFAIAPITRDIDDETKLRASILDALPLGVGLYDHRGHLVQANGLMYGYVGLTGPPSHDPALRDRWRAYDADDAPIPPDRYPGNRALRGETVTQGIDFLHHSPDGAERWVRVTAAPCQCGGETGAIVVAQDVDDLKRVARRSETASAELASQSRFLEATLSSIPDFVYAFDPEKRFAYANAAMLALFGLSSDGMLGRTFADLDYPPDLADELSGHIDRVLHHGVTTEGEVYYRSPTGYGAYFDFLWGPVRADDGSVELVVGVSRDTSERRAMEQKLRQSEAQLRAATDLVGLGVYSWDPATGALTWDERVRELWEVPPGAPVDMDVFEAGIHPDDLARVHEAIAACVDPEGDGDYHLEYRLIGRDTGEIRHIATSGRTTFAEGRAVGFIGAVIDVTAQRRTETSVRASEAQFRSFAEHSRSILWIGDPETDRIVYRSAAFERIWGVPREEGPTAFTEWIAHVHPGDRQQVERSLALVKAGEAVQFEYRIIRPGDGAVRWLRDTSFPIRDETGTVRRLGGITTDLSVENEHQIYIVSAKAGEARRLAALVRGLDYRVRSFESASAFLDVAPVLTSGCVLVDLRQSKNDCLAIPRELRARSIALPTIALGSTTADVASAVAAMKAGAIDFIGLSDDDRLRPVLLAAISDCQTIPPTTKDQGAGARLARLTPREHEVLIGLVDGGTNKTIGQRLGISPRTVELHRAQVMNRLNATSLTELIQIALAAGIEPSGRIDCNPRKSGSGRTDTARLPPHLVGEDHS